MSNLVGMPVTTQKGLRWKKDRSSGVMPEWTTDPSIEDITTLVRRELDIPISDPCVVQVLTQNNFNKDYIVTCGSGREYILRLTVPVDPGSKTMSEVATIKYLRHDTEVPVPQVICHQASTDNELGLEWILRERMPGRKLGDEWNGMDYLKKEHLVRKMASIHAQLFQQRFDQLGNLYPANELPHLCTPGLDDIALLTLEASILSQHVGLGKIVSAPFFWGAHIDHNVPRGPYKRSQDWLAAQLQLSLLDLDDESKLETSDEIKRSIYQNIIDSYPGEPDEAATTIWKKQIDRMDTAPHLQYAREKVEEGKQRAQRLLDLMPKIFPEKEDDEEEFVLHHHSLHASNILVDSNSSLTGISDWECAHTAPLWLACQLPSFLELTDSTAAVFAYLNIEYANEEYKTQIKLRQFFLEEMQRICPEWVEVHKASQLKVGFEQCVQHFGKAGDGKWIDRWIGEVEEKGSAPLLKEIIRAEWVRDYVHGGYPFGSGLF
ncbi:hypothetical protein J4E83_006676 [Alternaria metachromatica]|uniref:uncharacterized protein n=1 Tax=Alternaria metachromatica TaxID=283354 RepID=UPI0020C2B000|nr:uncharacterized protein J4E83_006676 [Alternaria metachromatica]KAI4616007.1 hypothetical protein J4E83_006676 [Alternaria metachromatica]